MVSGKSLECRQTTTKTVLMVDADTKVFPDALTHMVSAMVKDPEIMGLCGETKIANKRASWVSMIQVFEYFISHHLSKSFESVFGGVTCLPGCFFYVSHQGSKRWPELLGADSRQPRCCRTLLRERCRHFAQRRICFSLVKIDICRHSC